ncbi:ribonuclease domain-containing protein [Deinococcus maricopensis]|uniref:Guanine-specific ribonuclease N1 and T1 n=1 Tax=Deinococcus maricopensis (strain DSM 21211 / LMG 22137 / NRRL B-23946 / LB-34) TaxID=709986 RepID=E8U922_DEIML|nr:ribonuclease domain-containing protein [Deinococcus maricopensis]ADV67561.1 guanine-specific ribonuclease N1 and T1 [Deinococcus maricopensis DSM 21211]
MSSHRPTTRAPRWGGALLLALLVTLTACQSPNRQARTDAESGLPIVALQTLPPEARRTFTLIRAGGPFPHAQDGQVFGNRERLLPARPRGTYREYTVRTPGERDRGARRLVCAPRLECYYTADHYASFARVEP